jgi:hypothetical protein
MFSFMIQKKVYLHAIKRKRGLTLRRHKDGGRPENERMGTHHINISKVLSRKISYK